MADETAQGQGTTRRRGRPPGSGSTTGRARRKRLVGSELVTQLNAMIAELIKENRKLKRQVDKMTARGSAAASSTVERGLRTLQRRVQRALTAPAKRRRRKAAPAPAARRRTTTKKRRKPSA
jgi:hypothetical protein